MNKNNSKIDYFNHFYKIWFSYDHPLKVQRIHEWSSLDSALYTHFNNKLDLAIEQYGQARLQTELTKLRQLLRDVQEECVEVSVFLSLQCD